MVPPAASELVCGDDVGAPPADPPDGPPAAALDPLGDADADAGAEEPYAADGIGESVPAPAQYPVPSSAALLHSDWTANRSPALPVMFPSAP